MKQLFLMVNDGTVKLIDTPVPTVKDGYAIIETIYSVVSSGTERSLTSFGNKNLLQKAMERPDQVRKLTEKISTDGLTTTMEAAFTRLKEPMAMGYSAVGRVRECGQGITEVSVGDMVAIVGQAYHCEVNRTNKNLLVKIADDFPDIRQAAFSALGGIALEGIHQANVKPGETVAVIGLGLLGHITARILNAYGCPVIAFDVKDKTLAATRIKAFIFSDDDAAEEKVKNLTNGRGADKVIITAAADNNGPVDLAAAIARERGIICMIGVTRMELDRRPFYQKELTFTIARSYGPGRYDSNYEEKGQDYPVAYVRFTEQRNVEEFLRLICEKRMDISDLITHEIPFEQAVQAYEMISVNSAHIPYIGILLKYSENADKWAGTIINPISEKTTFDKNQIKVGLIGAGNFAKNTLLPIMKETGKYHYRGLATTGGVGTAQVQETFVFDYTTNDYRNLLEDPEIDLIIVSTQHNTHAKFILEALRAGKHVYCEKPICLTLNELDEIEEFYYKCDRELFCGLNRRYAPMIRQARKQYLTNQIPAVYEYVVNAGMIPQDHWTQDQKAGGGRIIGEACHFIDTIQYLDGSELVDLGIVFADNPAFPQKDNAVINLKFSSGAVGTILYTAMGSKKYPKERLTIFAGGNVCTINNYLGMEMYGSTARKKINLNQDKGVKAEYLNIYNVLTGKKKNKDILDCFLSQRKLLEKYFIEPEQ